MASTEDDHAPSPSPASVDATGGAAAAAPVVPAPSPSPSSSPSFATTWKLPTGIEDDVEDALIKTAIGAAAGGLFGMIFMRAGTGRAASVATGIGVAAGSSYERIKLRYDTEQLKQQQQK